RSAWPRSSGWCSGSTRHGRPRASTRSTRCDTNDRPTAREPMSKDLMPPLGILVLVAAAGPVPADSVPDEQSLLKVADGGYHTYRIPSLIVTNGGVLLAFCEGRKSGRGDTGDIDLVLKRSRDGGKTWDKTQVVWDDADNTCGNPCPVVDRN